MGQAGRYLRVGIGSVMSVKGGTAEKRLPLQHAKSHGEGAKQGMGKGDTPE